MAKPMLRTYAQIVEGILPKDWVLVQEDYGFREFKSKRDPMHILCLEPEVSFLEALAQTVACRTLLPSGVFLGLTGKERAGLLATQIVPFLYRIPFIEKKVKKMEAHIFAVSSQEASILPFDQKINGIMLHRHAPWIYNLSYG